MQRLYFSLSILILFSFLPGCAPRAVAQPAEVRALENLPEIPGIDDVPEPPPPQPQLPPEQVLPQLEAS